MYDPAIALFEMEAETISPDELRTFLQDRPPYFCRRALLKYNQRPTGNEERIRIVIESMPSSEILLGMIERMDVRILELYAEMHPWDALTIIGQKKEKGGDARFWVERMAAAVAGSSESQQTKDDVALRIIKDYPFQTFVIAASFPHLALEILKASPGFAAPMAIMFPDQAIGIAIRYPHAAGRIAEVFPDKKEELENIFKKIS